MPETGKAEQYSQYVAMCSEDAYTIARSACIMFGMDAIESHIMVGVQSGAARLDAVKRSLLARDLLKRLYGKTPVELIEEQRQQVEEEGANLARMFSDD